VVGWDCSALPLGHQQSEGLPVGGSHESEAVAWLKKPVGLCDSDRRSGE
jgi:hypothetical protein